MADGGTATNATIALAAGLLFAGIGGYVFVDQQLALTSRETVEGTVEGTGIEREGGPNSGYNPLIRYEYTYEGTAYTSQNVFPGVDEKSVSKSRAESIADGYDEGDPITVYVDPENPGEAHVVRETDYTYLIPFGLGVVIAGLSLRDLLRN